MLSLESSVCTVSAATECGSPEDMLRTALFVKWRNIKEKRQKEQQEKAKKYLKARGYCSASGTSECRTKGYPDCKCNSRGNRKHDIERVSIYRPMRRDNFKKDVTFKIGGGVEYRALKGRVSLGLLLLVHLFTVLDPRSVYEQSLTKGVLPGCVRCRLFLRCH